MKSRIIYKKKCCFVWPRVPCSIAGGFALLFFPYAAIRLTEKMDGLLPGFLLAAMSAAGILLAKSITSFGAKQANLAQLSMMTRGIVYGVLPENVKKEGYRVAKSHFEYITVGEISRRAFEKASDRFFYKGKEQSSDKDSSKRFTAELKTFTELFLVTSLPYIGECTLAWEFAFPGATLEESICDSIEVIRNNWLRIIFLFLTETLLLILYVFMTVAVSGTVIVLFLEYLPCAKFAADAAAGFASRFLEYEALEGNSFLMFPIYLVILAVLPFFRSSIRIMTLRTFFKAADRKPPKGKVYARLGKTIRFLHSGIKARRRDEIPVKQN